jgi:hypothetical protein
MSIQPIKKIQRHLYHKILLGISKPELVWAIEIGYEDKI